MAGTDPKHLAARLRTITRAANPTGVLPDAELIRRYAETRDEAAFEVLVWRHGPMVWGTCCRILHQQQDTEDAFQATFLALTRSARSLEGRESVAAWLHRVASNAALKVATRRRPTAKLPPEVPDEAPGNPADRELAGVIDQELDRLPDHYRATFVLCCLEGLTNAEAPANWAAQSAPLIPGCTRLAPGYGTGSLAAGSAPMLWPVSPRC